MIIIHFGMQEEDVIIHTHAKCHVFLDYSIQTEDIIEHISVKCHVFAPITNLLIIL